MSYSLSECISFHLRIILLEAAVHALQVFQDVHSLEWAEVAFEPRSIRVAERVTVEAVSIASDQRLAAAAGASHQLHIPGPHTPPFLFHNRNAFENVRFATDIFFPLILCASLLQCFGPAKNDRCN